MGHDHGVHRGGEGARAGTREAGSAARKRERETETETEREESGSCSSRLVGVVEGLVGARGCGVYSDRMAHGASVWPGCIVYMECTQVYNIVNTKNWYREETDLWAEFGKKHHSARGFPQSIR
jgi:hypothetical protein